MELFDKYNVFNNREMHSRYEIGLEQYMLTIGVEARLTLEVGATSILPAAVRYQTELAQNVASLIAAGVEADTALLEAMSRIFFHHCMHLICNSNYQVGPTCQRKPKMISFFRY